MTAPRVRPHTEMSTRLQQGLKLLATLLRAHVTVHALSLLITAVAHPADRHAFGSAPRGRAAEARVHNRKADNALLEGGSTDVRSVRAEGHGMPSDRKPSLVTPNRHAGDTRDIGADAHVHESGPQGLRRQEHSRIIRVKAGGNSNPGKMREALDSRTDRLLDKGRALLMAVRRRTDKALLLGLKVNEQLHPGDASGPFGRGRPLKGRQILHETGHGVGLVAA